LLKFKVQRSGGVSINDMKTRMLHIKDRLKISEINSLLKSVANESVETIKEFLLNKTYEKLGSSYTPLSDSWMKRKVLKFMTHFYINTQELLNGIYSKVSGGTLHIKPAKGMEERYAKLEHMRPIIEDHKEYLTKQIMDKVWEKFNQGL
jgi:hypothetical protein